MEDGPALRSLIERYLRAYNARDLDAWSELFDEHVEVVGDAGVLHGREAAREFAAQTMRAFSGVRAELTRVVAQTADTIVVEYRLVNSAEQVSERRLDGSVCDIYEVRDGRIVRCHSYYLPDAADRTDAAPLPPSRAETTRIAEERAALRRVAALVAGGVSPGELFDAANAEIARLVGADATALLRFESDDTVTLAAASPANAPIGARQPVDEPLRAVRESGRAARFGPADMPTAGPFGDAARALGVRAAVAVPIEVDRCVWGVSVAASVHDEPFPADTEERIAGFAELVATAIAHAQARAELERLIAELTASRARVVAAADETRRRIQRDLHDGAQQRLVHTIISLKLARAALGADGNPGAPADLIDAALEHAQRATADLRELVQGIMPATLGRGLRAGIEAIASQMDLPVRIDVTRSRLPPAVERTAYFIVAEALTNALKHAHATAVHVRAVVRGETLELEVRDDGVGGADPAGGTGLVGLTDRVAVGGGTIAITSPPGGGTTLAVTLPMHASAETDAGLAQRSS